MVEQKKICIVMGVISGMMTGYVFIIFQVITAKSKVCLGECEFRDIGMEK